MLERRMKENAAALCLLLSSACGGKVVFDVGAGGSGDASTTHATSSSSSTHAVSSVSTGSAPTDLPWECYDADNAIDWSQCPDEPTDSRVTRSYCANIIASNGCDIKVGAYFECLAKNPSSCVETPNPSSGSAGFTIHSDACEQAQQAFEGCISTCVGGSTCPTTACTCDPSSSFAGAPCCWYPNCPYDQSIENCFAICEMCNAQGD